jgi:serine/threonine protein kinase
MSQYQIIKQIGKGYFGEVFSAIYNSQMVCIKRIKIFDQKSYEDAQQEIDVWCNLKHPNIIQYYQCFIEQDQFCVMMELVDGPTLEQFFAQYPNIPEPFVLKLFSQLLSAMKCYHSHKVLYRDIKL